MRRDLDIVESENIDIMSRTGSYEEYVLEAGMAGVVPFRRREYDDLNALCALDDSEWMRRILTT